MTDFADIRARTRRMEKTVELCLDGGLFAEHETAARELDRAVRRGEATLGGGPATDAE